MSEPRKYKIVFVGNFAPTSVGEPEIAWALEQEGHQVIRLEESTTDLTKVRVSVLREKPDFLLFAKFRVGDKFEVRQFLSGGCTVPTVCWLFDLYWGYRREKEIVNDMLPAFAANIVFTTDGGHEDKWKRYNIKHFLLRQGIDERVRRSKTKYDTKAEIGFVGGRHTWAGWPYRGQLLDFLSATYGDRFGHFGEDKEVRHEELNSLLSTLKITICDSVESPRYWSNRIYEMMGRGAFVIHPRLEGLSEEFTEFKHFIPYNYGNFKDLKNKIDYYLEHDKEREAIRKAGYDYCHKNLTYRHRVKELLKKLEEQKKI